MNSSRHCLPLSWTRWRAHSSLMRGATRCPRGGRSTSKTSISMPSIASSPTAPGMPQTQTAMSITHRCSERPRVEGIPLGRPRASLAEPAATRTDATSLRLHWHRGAGRGDTPVLDDASAHASLGASTLAHQELRVGSGSFQRAIRGNFQMWDTPASARLAIASFAIAPSSWGEGILPVTPGGRSERRAGDQAFENAATLGPRPELREGGRGAPRNQGMARSGNRIRGLAYRCRHPRLCGTGASGARS